MMTSFPNTLVLFFLALLAIVSAAPMLKRDVFVPPIEYPHAGTVWKVGQKHNVTWYVYLIHRIIGDLLMVYSRSTADAPAQITNSQGMVVLVKQGLLDLGKLTPLKPR